jgi:hypothetical protein
MQELWHKHIWKITFIICLPLISAWAFADEIVGYTEHGISVTKNDIEIKSVRVDSIRSWKWIEETDTLRLTLNRKKQVDVEFFNRCFDMPYATGLQFKPWGGFNSIGKGDSITPISWSNRITQWPCTIKRITEVIEDDDVR